MPAWARVVLAAILVAFSASSAWAHGDVESYQPEAGSRLAEPPTTIVVTLTEAPSAGGSSVRVSDGCDDPVVERVSVRGSALVARIADAQPGLWNVRWRAVSGVDGHPSKGAYAFGVRGKPDCSAPRQAQRDDGAASSETESSPPWSWFVGGTVVLIALATFLRRATNN